EPVDPVLARQVNGAGKDFFLVFENRFYHFRGGGRGGIVSAAGLEILHDLGSAVARPLDNDIQPVLGNQLGDGNSGHGGIARQGNHGIAVAAQHEGGHVFHAYIQFLRDEGTEARGIEHPGHADHAIAGELAELVRRLGHGVERVGNDDEDAVGRVDHHLGDHVLHDLEIGVEQVVAAHARLARDAGGDHHNVRVGRVGVVVGAHDVAI